MIIEIILICLCLLVALLCIVLGASFLQHLMVDHSFWLRKEYPIQKELFTHPEFSELLKQKAEFHHPSFLIRNFIQLTDDDVIVLLQNAPNTSCLFRFHPDGSLVWQAEVPDAIIDDGYAYVQYNLGKLTANSFSCFFVEIDINSGKIISQTFTK